jgi:hypothetical protein
MMRAALAGGLAAVVLMGAPASAIADDVIDAAVAAGIAGEQANGDQIGLVGIRDEARATADLRARIADLNAQRRAAFIRRAEQRGARPAEMAAAVACEIFRSRIAVGEYYRDETGSWRQHTAAAPVAVPSYCPPA